MMTLKDFINTKCKDILDRKKALCLDDEDNIFSYDATLQDSYGNVEKVIYDDNGIPIKIDDIIELSEEDFKNVYQTNSSIEAYRKYLSAYRVIYGEELFKLYCSKINETMKQLNKYDATLTVSDLDESFGLGLF